MGLKTWPLTGTQGTALTTANSGALALAVGGGGSATYDSTLGAKFTSGTDISSSIAQLAPDVTNANFSFSVVVTLPGSVPSVPVALVKFHGTNYATQLVYATNGAVQVVGHNLQIAAWTTGVSAGGTYRFTFWGTVSATAGASTLHARMYNSSGTQINSVDTTTADLGTAPFTEIWVGSGANGTAGIIAGVKAARWNSGGTTELTDAPAISGGVTDNRAELGPYTATGGTGPYTYTISPTTGTTSIGTGHWLVTKGATEQTFTVTVTDANSQTSTKTETIAPVGTGGTLRYYDGTNIITL